MVKVPNGVELLETLPKISTGRVRRMSATDRQTTDGRATAYSEREREFTFAKTEILRRNSPVMKYVESILRPEESMVGKDL